MYIVDEKKIAAAENFIQSLPESIVKGNYERWLEKVKITKQINGEQLEKFHSFTNALPIEFQNFPQYYAHCVKNGVDVENQEETSKGKKSVKTKK